MGRRAPQRRDDLPRAADRRGRDQARRSADPGSPRRRLPRRDDSQGRSPLRWQPAFRRRDDQPHARGGRRRRWARASGFRALRARRPARLAFDGRAPDDPARLGGGPELLGRLDDADRGHREHRPRHRADFTPGKGPGGLDRRLAAGRRAGVLVQARPDSRRRLLDAAEVGAGPQALPGRQLHHRAGRRARRRSRRDGRRPLREGGVAWPRSRACPRTNSR